MKVNMTPNPLDVVTIHASQGDTEARQWEFELHNNGELIDTSNVTEQMFFKAYKGGTEQLLPENGSTPTTSPFLGDIKYPQGLLTDQEFAYRQSPTEKDGNAKITDIKGNTIVWNQLVHGDFGNNYASYWYVYSGTGSVSNGVLTVTNAIGRNGVRLWNHLNLIQGHYYYCSFEYKSDVQLTTHFVIRENILPATNAFVKFSNIYQFNGASAKDVDTFPSTEGQTGTFSLKNVQCMDLTAMGIDNLTTVQEVEGWLSNNIGLLPYYAYNQGSLLSFNGTGLKSASEDASKEDTLALPVATYFPTGMKSAGNVYDELTESKAITRIGSVDLGSLEWSYNSTYGMYSTGISNSVKKPSASSVRANAISSVGTFTDWTTFYASGTSSGLLAINTSGYIGIATTGTNSTTFKNSLQGQYLYYELATPTETPITTASLVTENAEIPLSNEDGTLIGKCTEQLSENPGFIDAKIKLSDADGECYSNKIQLHVERSPQ